MSISGHLIMQMKQESIVSELSKCVETIEEMQKIITDAGLKVNETYLNKLLKSARKYIKE